MSIEVFTKKGRKKSYGKVDRVVLVKLNKKDKGHPISNKELLKQVQEKAFEVGDKIWNEFGLHKGRYKHQNKLRQKIIKKRVLPKLPIGSLKKIYKEICKTENRRFPKSQGFKGDELIRHEVSKHIHRGILKRKKNKK